MIHEDERRILESFPEAKIIKVKQDCVIGEHYHKIKTEQFILCEGKCKLIMLTTDLVGFGRSVKMKIGELFVIPPGIYHEFHISAESVLIGINSHPYDKSDDYKIDFKHNIK